MELHNLWLVRAVYFPGKSTRLLPRHCLVTTTLRQKFRFLTLPLLIPTLLGRRWTSCVPTRPALITLLITHHFSVFYLLDKIRARRCKKKKKKELSYWVIINLRWIRKVPSKQQIWDTHTHIYIYWTVFLL